MADDNKTINPNNVSTGSPVEGGCCYTNFEVSPTLPDTASEDIAGDTSKWVNLGELSNNGYTKSVSITANDFTGWHGSLLLSQVDNETNTFKAEFTEIVRIAVLKVRYGVNAVKLDSDGNLLGVNPTTTPTTVLPLLFDELLSNDMKMRTVFPRAVINQIDDEPHQRGSLLVYGITFKAMVDSQGRPYYIRYAKAASGAAAAA